MGNARFYVYAHVRPEDNVVFYIGKGCKKRAWSEKNRNTHWKNVVGKHGFNVVVLADSLTESQAIEEEAQLISHFKKYGKLVNVLARGDINPMSNPETAKKVAETKRLLGQYDGKTIKDFNAKFKEKMRDNSAFAEEVVKNRKKAASASRKVRKEKVKDLILKILELKKEGVKQKDIANLLSVSQASVSRIVNGKAYA